MRVLLGSVAYTAGMFLSVIVTGILLRPVIGGIPLVAICLLAGIVIPYLLVSTLGDALRTRHARREAARRWPPAVVATRVREASITRPRSS